MEDEVVHMEDLPEGTIIAKGAFKSQKGIPLKLNGVPVGTCDIDIDEEGNATYHAEFVRTKLSPGVYDLMFTGYREGISIGHENVFENVSEEDQGRADPGVGKTKAPFRLPGR